jgi:hypothetical protein
MQSPVQLPVQSMVGVWEHVGSQLTSSWLAHESSKETGVHLIMHGLSTSTVHDAFASTSMFPQASIPAFAGSTNARAEKAKAAAAK